jgi:hypothetical protein
VESTENTLGGIIESRVVTNLPVNGRDYQKLIFLVPGVAGSPDQITDSPGSFGVFSVNGARGRSNNFLLDGTDMNDGYRNDPAINQAGVYGTPSTILPVEAIAELRVLSNFEAEFGRNSGAVINVVTKSGTNQLHGSGFEFLRNTALNARNYFNPKSQPKQPFHNNQFGGSLAGPIFRDKTFFFLDYEGMRESGGLNYTTRVPTVQEIQAATADNGGVVNPVIAKLLARNPWPVVNTAAGVALFDPNNNAFVATPFSNRVDSAIIKIDHQFNQNNLFTGRYYIGDSDQSFPLGLVGGSLLPGFNVVTPTRVQLVSLSYTTTISPTIINEARLGWNRYVQGFFPQDRSFDPSTIGLNTGATQYNFGLPRINVGNFAQIGANNTVPRQRVDTNWHYIDNISWKAGKHDIKFGYEFRRTSISQIFNDQFRGKITFGGSLRTALDEFIAGTPTGGGTQTGNTNRNTFENSHSGYFQDSFHMTRKFVLNLGLRYDYNGIIQEKNGNFTNVIPGSNGQLTQVVVGNGRLYQPDYNNWAPRVSAAWDITGKGTTVVRAGYGIFYDAYSADFFIGQAPYNSNFDAGSAYAAFGPNPISFASTNTSTIVSGQPVFNAAGPLPDAFGVNRNIRTPYLENYNLNLQQQLTQHMVVQVGYVGSQGHKLMRTRDINQPSQAQITACDLGGGPGSICPGAPSIHNGSVPRQFNSPFFYINFLESASNSKYDALQTSWRINAWHHLTSSVNYTWSHSIDDSSDGFDYVPNASQPNDSSAPNRFNRGNSNFDVRNRFTWNFFYEFPNRTGSLERLTNGWGMSGTVTAQSGQPFHLNYNFEDDFDGSGEFFGRPDIVAPVKYNYSDPTHFLDLSSFAVPCTPGPGFSGGASQCVPGTRHFGTLGRNSLLGPHFRQVDFSIYKDTKITERVNLQLRLEAYNLFNHPNFANPYLPFFITDPAINGTDATGHHTGFFPLASTGDVGVGYPFLGSGGNRGLQVGAKFTF